jgi:hypothetical protein
MILHLKEEVAVTEDIVILFGNFHSLFIVA